MRARLGSGTASAPPARVGGNPAGAAPMGRSLRGKVQSRAWLLDICAQQAELQSKGEPASAPDGRGQCVLHPQEGAVFRFSCDSLRGCRLPGLRRLPACWAGRAQPAAALRTRPQRAMTFAGHHRPSRGAPAARAGSGALTVPYAPGVAGGRAYGQ
jgi:hypothetical protein